MVTKRQRQKEKKRQQRKQLIVGGTLAFIMVFGVIGWAVQGSPTSNVDVINFQGITFEVRQEGAQGQIVFYAQTDMGEIAFYNDPFSINNLDQPENFSQVVRNAESLSFTSDPDRSLGQGEDIIQRAIIQDARRYADLIVERAYTEETRFSDGRPVRDCDDATQRHPVVLLERNINATDLYYEISDYCFGLDGDEFDLLTARDQLLMNLLGWID